MLLQQTDFHRLCIKFMSLAGHAGSTSCTECIQWTIRSLIARSNMNYEGAEVELYNNARACTYLYMMCKLIHMKLYIQAFERISSPHRTEIRYVLTWE